MNNTLVRKAGITLIWICSIPIRIVAYLVDLIVQPMRIGEWIKKIEKDEKIILYAFRLLFNAENAAQIMDARNELEDIKEAIKKGEL